MSTCKIPNLLSCLLSLSLSVARFLRSLKRVLSCAQTRVHQNSLTRHLKDSIASFLSPLLLPRRDSIRFLNQKSNVRQLRFGIRTVGGVIALRRLYFSSSSCFGAYACCSSSRFGAYSYFIAQVTKRVKNVYVTVLDAI